LGSGISHFLEHMVFKGTRDMDGETLASSVQAAGGHWNAYTTFERTVYYIDGPSDSLEMFLRALTGMVFFPTLPEEDFEKEKDVIRREIDMGLDDPDNASTRLLLATAFLLDPRKHPVIGHRHLFDAISYQDLTDYHRSRYTTDRCHLVISGDIDIEAVRALAMKLTSDCKPGCGREPFVAVDDPCPAPRMARETFAVPTSRIAMSWKTPPAHHADTAAWDVLAAMLGRGRSARLYQSLREKAGLAVEVSAFHWSQPGREGIFAISAEAEVEKRDSLMEAIPRELAALAADATQDALDRARRQIAVSQFKILTTASGRAADLASNWHEARDLDHTRRFLAAMEAVTVDDVKRLAARLTECGRVTTVVDPEGSPPPARARKPAAKRREVMTVTLSNGLQCALIPDSRAPMVHMHVAARAGLPSEDGSNNGLGHLMAAVLPKGTQRRTGEEIALALESLGASMGAASGNNAFTARATCLSDDFQTVAGLFAECLREPAFDALAVEREKTTQLAAIAEAELEPLHSAFRKLRSAFFGGGGYGLDAMGAADAVRGLDREALARHHARHLCGANLTLALAGDFDPESAVDLLQQWFGDMPEGEAWKPPVSQWHPGVSVSGSLPKKQAALAIGFPGVSASDPRRHAMAMIQEHAADMAGPLFTRIREELGLTYQVGATQFHGFDGGMFTCYLATAPEQVDLAREELLKEMSKIALEGIPSEVFERVRATVLGGLALQQQSPGSLASHATLDLMFGHPADARLALPEIYRNITPDDVRAVAAEFFTAPPAVSVVRPG
jgi:zinc protease